MKAMKKSPEKTEKAEYRSTSTQLQLHLVFVMHVCWNLTYLASIANRS